MRRVLQSSADRGTVLGLLFVGLWVPAVYLLVTRPSPWGVYASAWVFTAYWVLGSAQLLWLRPADWRGETWRHDLAGVTMLVGVLTHLLHVWLAFTAVHGGSHAAAVAHTARTAGIGWAIVVNYLFTTVWLADTVWLTARPASYARRPRWVGRGIHGFLAFVVFNATVVYGEPMTRLAGVGWFAVLGVSWWRRGRLARRASEDGVRPR